ncbi:MAG: AI-2E family transporter, partial [Planctomycetes bacterium]|nr:AI-2E family transporter [Planctomycetota bacterium]
FTLVVVILVISLMGLLVTASVGTVVSTEAQYTHVIEGLILDGYDQFVEWREWFEERGEEVTEPLEGPEPVAVDATPEQLKPGDVDKHGHLIYRSAPAYEIVPTIDGGIVAIPIQPDANDHQRIPDPNDGQTIAGANAPSVTSEGKSLSGDLRDDLRMILGHFDQQIQAFLFNAGGLAWDILLSIIFVSIFVIFLLSGRDPRVVRKGIYADIEQKIRRYILTKVAISTVTGLLVWFTLDKLGLPLANVFGILAFLLNFIPSIGSIISTMLPIPIAVAQHQAGHGDLVWLMLVILVPGLIQFVIGSLIDPKLMGEGLNLHPVTILLALSFWGLLWGIVGAFLAAPITAAIRIVLMQFDTLKPVGMLLAGQFSAETEEYRRRPAKVVTETESEEPSTNH